LLVVQSFQAAAYPFRPHAKTVADHTLERSITTKPLTIQPPPVHAINDVACGGSIVAHDLKKS